MGRNRKLITVSLLILIPLLVIIPAYAPTTIITDTSVSTNNVFVSQDTNSTRIFENGNRVLTKASSIDDLNDVVVSSPSDGQVLKYNSGTAKWENQATAGAAGGGGQDYFSYRRASLTTNGTGWYTASYHGFGFGGGSTFGGDRLLAEPFIVGKSITLDRIGVDWDTPNAGQNCRLGIYNSNEGLYPTSLVLDAGEVTGGNTIGMHSISISPSLTLTANNLYWLAIVCDNDGFSLVRLVSTSGNPTDGILGYGGDLNSPNLDATGYGWKVFFDWTPSNPLPSTYPSGAGRLDLGNQIHPVIPAVFVRVAS